MATIRSLEEFNSLPDRRKESLSIALKNRFQRYAFAYTLYTTTGELAMWGTVITRFVFDANQSFLTQTQYDEVRKSVAADYSAKIKADKPYTSVSFVSVTRLEVSIEEIFSDPGFYFDYSF